ncbi:MAG: endonuclease/exonuclease/phosphatase family protein [Prevotella sp.]|nr:endonuclease/exonuclease/phosphatase family protein [Prevotella sp.]
MMERMMSLVMLVRRLVVVGVVLGLGSDVAWAVMDDGRVSTLGDWCLDDGNEGDTLAMESDSAALMVDTLGMGSDSVVMMVDSLAMVPDSVAMMVDSLGMGSDSAAMMVDSLVMVPDSVAMMADSIEGLGVMPEEGVRYMDSTLTVMHWNIGHFALGASHQTRISEARSKSMMKRYHAVLDSIDADVIGVCEYSAGFSDAGEDASLVVFGNYKYDFIGMQYKFVCNGIFSKLELDKKQSRMRFFEVAFPDYRYAALSRFNLCGEDVLFIQVHLDTNQSGHGKEHRASQYREILEWAEQFPYVIVCGDFNCSFAEYEIMTENGYNSVSERRSQMCTYPSGDPTNHLDNILVKGFEILTRNIHSDAKLSDHSIIWTKLRMKARGEE